mmetsp:Transcript_1092/g.2993  ORF Transcript_1092/g.2993 Transcript_1092/m.2993 type:complete len:152 (-) Transcript_1092:263-718(-)
MAVLSEPPGQEAQERLKRHYHDKFREALYNRQVRLYEQAWEECVRREVAQASVEVAFRVRYDTFPGQELKLIGSTRRLGSWSIDKSIHMHWTSGNIWTVTLAFPRRPLKVEYKYVVSESPSRVRWEEGRNHVLEILGDSRPVERNDQWGQG